MEIRVLLINPFLTVYPDDPAGINPVLSLAYLAAYLRSKKIIVKIIDIAAEGAGNRVVIGNKIRYGLEEEEIISRIKEFNPQVVGITCQSTLHAKDSLESAKIAKKAVKSSLVVMGGAHPSAVPEEVLANKSVDVVVRGEGEITFLEIIKNYQKKNGLENIEGISFKKGSRIIHNSPRTPIKNLDLLPFPARDLLPMDIYFSEGSKNPDFNYGKRVITMVTSRGCPGRCVYCAVKAVWGRVWRGRSPKNVVDEIEELVSEYRTDEIHFLDDSLSVDKKRLEGICDELIKRKIQIKWTTPNGIAVWLLDKKLILKMKKSGCYRLTFGLESGNKEILKDFIGKEYEYDKAREIIRFASKAGLWTVGTFIIGFPFEKADQIKDTIDFAISTDLDFATFFIANPFPGTPLYDMYKKEKLLPAGGAYEIVRGCSSKYFSHQQLINMQSAAFSSFLKSRLHKPLNIFLKINSISDLLYTLKLAKRFFSVYGSSVKNLGISALWKK